jgi:MFS family permease
MGWLRSLTNLFGNVIQILWGIISDKRGRYVPAILIGGILSAILWLPLLVVTTPLQLIAIVALQAFATSIVTPAWTSLIGKLTPEKRRGTTTSRINIAASFGSIAATLISGYIMTLVGGSLSMRYMIPIILATVFGSAASLIMMRVRETPHASKTSVPWLNWDVFRRNVDFQTLCKVSFVHSFFMSMAWPLFAITTVEVVKADMMQIAYISAISGVVGIVARRFVGRVTDYAGRKTLLILSRAGIFIFPTIYALSTTIYHLFLANLIVGVFGAISDIVLFAYQLDITPPEQRGASIAFYNTVNGIATFLGSLCGGYIPLLFTWFGFAGYLPLQFTYAISATGRLCGGLLFSKIREPSIYPSTVKREIVRIVSEDIERTKDQIKQIEARSEETEKGLQKDFEWLDNMIIRREEK